MYFFQRGRTNYDGSGESNVFGIFHDGLSHHDEHREAGSDAYAGENLVSDSHAKIGIGGHVHLDATRDGS